MANGISDYAKDRAKRLNASEQKAADRLSALKGEQARALLGGNQFGIGSTFPTSGSRTRQSPQARRNIPDLQRGIEQAQVASEVQDISEWVPTISDIAPFDESQITDYDSDYVWKPEINKPEKDKVKGEPKEEGWLERLSQNPDAWSALTDMGLGLLTRQGPEYGGFQGAMRALGEAGQQTQQNLRSTNAARAAGARQERELAVKELTAQTGADKNILASRKMSFDAAMKAKQMDIKISQKSIDQAVKLLETNMQAMNLNPNEATTKVLELASQIEADTMGTNAVSNARRVIVEGGLGKVSINPS